MIGVATTSDTLSVTGVGLLVVSISAGVAFALSLGKKVLHKIILNKDSTYKNNMRRITKPIKFLINYTEKVYKKIYLIKMNLTFYVIILLNTLMKRKMKLFYGTT